VVREAFGFAEPGPEDHVHRNELSVVPAIQLQLSEGFRPVVIGRWLRVCGDSLRRIAETEAAGWHSGVVMALLASGMAEVEVLAAQADLGSRMAPLREQALVAIYHGQQETRLEPGLGGDCALSGHSERLTMVAVGAR
jgi:hypothetical protein